MTTETSISIRAGISMLALAAFTGFAVPGVARAQSQTAAAPPTTETELEEIVVTATRREQRLVDVSASLTALTEERLRLQGIDNFERLVASVPGIIANTSIRNSTYFNIRGLSTNSAGGYSQNPVSIYINDAPVSDTFAAVFHPDLRLFDVERVEVLRGPQGTLYGSGALGGTVRIITNQPDASGFASAGGVEFGVTDGGGLRQRYDGMVNFPLVADKLAIRVVGYYRNEEGWVENPNIGTRNDSIDYGFRGALDWTPSDKDEILATLIYQDSDPEDADSWNPANGKFNRSASIPTPRDGQIFNANLTWEHAFDGFGTFSSASTYHKSESSLLGDVGPVFGPLHLVSLSRPWDSRLLTQEFRLVSDSDKPLTWVSGAFYTDRETDISLLYSIPGLDQVFGGIIGSDDYQRSQQNMSSYEAAVYGDVTYAFDSGLELFGGLRAFQTKSTYSEPNQETLNLFALLVLGVATYDSASFLNTGKDDGITWRAGASYEMTPNSQVYASVSTGYRVGQANPSSGPSPWDPTDVVIPPSFAGDSTLNYEIGTKGMFADGKLGIYLSLFYITWEDIQQQFFRFSDGAAFVDNAGDANAKGLELEVNASPFAGLEMGVALTFQRAEITELSNQEAFQTGVQEGDRLPGSIEEKYSGFVQYTHELSGGGNIYGRLDAQHTSSSPNQFEQAPFGQGANPFYAINEAYDSVDLQLGYRARRWGVTLYGENVTNNDAYILNFGSPVPDPIVTLRPRTVGIRLDMHY